VDLDRLHRVVGGGCPGRQSPSELEDVAVGGAGEPPSDSLPAAVRARAQWHDDWRLVVGRRAAVGIRGKLDRRVAAEGGGERVRRQAHLGRARTRRIAEDGVVIALAERGVFHESAAVWGDVELDAVG
jgi:hypothetical protein